MSDRLQGIDAFVQAVEAGSFARAAERLGLTRSAVGKTIARLEHRLGVRLFHRTTRQQSLTEDGQAYYEHCLRALAELESAEASLESGRNIPSGRLRVSAPALFGRYCVAPVLLDLARQHPRLALEMTLDDRVVDLVDEGFDLAIRIGRLPDSASLTARKLGTQRMAICASPAYLAAHGKPKRVDELDRHTGILYSRPGHEAPWRVLDTDGEAREVRIRSRLRFDDLQTITDAAIAGAGLAWLPCWLAMRHIRTGELALVMDARRVLGSDIHAVWPQGRYLPAKVRTAIDTLVERVPVMMGYQIADDASGHRAIAAAEVDSVAAE
jgi:DNA-binding transcriptional LysR family regulator